MAVAVADIDVCDGNSHAVADIDVDAASATADAIVAGGGNALAVATDVTDPESVQAMVARVAEELGEPTVLVNNAGIVRDNLLFKMSLDDWESVIRVHLQGAFLMSRALQEPMVRARWGRIVNISSVSALGLRGQSNYSTAKAGLQGLTKTLAIELGPLGVTVNCIAPGLIETDMTRATAERLGLGWEEYLEPRVANIPVRRVGIPEDIAHAVSFMTSEDAGFVTGQVLYVAGGPRA